MCLSYTFQIDHSPVMSVNQPTRCIMLNPSANRRRNKFLRGRNQVQCVYSMWAVSHHRLSVHSAYPTNPLLTLCLRLDDDLKRRVPKCLTPGLAVTTKVSPQRKAQWRMLAMSETVSRHWTGQRPPSRCRTASFAWCLLPIMADDGLDSINRIVRGWDLLRFLINGQAPAARARYRTASSDVCVCVVMTERARRWWNSLWLSNDCAHLIIGCAIRKHCIHATIQYNDTITFNAAQQTCTQNTKKTKESIHRN